MFDAFPRRIVCLTEEPTEVLYAIGEADRIVGISGFTVRPAGARKEKPKVSAFTSARIDDIVRLEPDFVIGFSDIQADIAQALIKLNRTAEALPYLDRLIEEFESSEYLEQAKQLSETLKSDQKKAKNGSVSHES